MMIESDLIACNSTEAQPEFFYWRGGQLTADALLPYSLCHMGAGLMLRIYITQTAALLCVMSCPPS